MIDAHSLVTAVAAGVAWGRHPLHVKLAAVISLGASMPSVLLLHLDGRMPNLALMRIAHHHRARGDQVRLQRIGRGRPIQPTLGEPTPDHVYASAIFKFSKPLIEMVRREYPDAIIGGTGTDVARTLEGVGIATEGTIDYSDYSDYTASLGFTQRGCRLRCGFCVVPTKEGAVRGAHTIAEIWRGDPWPRDIHLLDNDFFGQEHWRDRIDELRAGGFRVNFNQGINARFLTDESAAAIASVKYRNVNMRDRRIYTAWDNARDEARLFLGLEALVRHGVKRSHIVVYLLVGYDPAETAADRDDRRSKLRAFGATPYPMPYVRTRELMGFQRFCVRNIDKSVRWSDFARAGYYAENIAPAGQSSLFEVAGA